MESFKASTQYGDWEGTAAADDQRGSLREWLDGKGLISPNEFIVAVSLFVSEEIHSVRVFVSQNMPDLKSVKEEVAATKGPIPIRELKVDLTTAEFFALFKRFHVMLTWHDLQLEGREYIAQS